MSLDRTIYPFEGVGPLRFGMTLTQIVEMCGAPDRQIEYSDGTVVVYYPSDLLALHFDSDGKLEFIEWHASRGALLGGVAIEAAEVSKVAELLRPFAGAPTSTDAGIDFPDVGVALYVSDGVIEGIAAHKLGYYDDDK